MTWDQLWQYSILLKVTAMQAHGVLYHMFPVDRIGNMLNDGTLKGFELTNTKEDPQEPGMIGIS